MKAFVSKTGIWLLLLLSRAPMWALFLISDVLYIVIYKLSKYRTAVVRKNLSLSFPEMNAGALLKTERAYYRYLSDLVMETVKGFTAGESFFRKRISYTNQALLQDLYERKQSAVVVMGHSGNWEWVCRSAPFYMKNRVVVAYKPLTDKYFDKLMYDVRTEFGVVQVPMAQIGRYILTEKEPFLLILLSDQSPSDLAGCHWCRFMNQDTAVLTGVEKLALKFNLPIVYGDVKRKERGYYHCHFQYLLEVAKSRPEPGQITELHTGFLEQMIREQPETWLWSHKRWKLKRND